MADHSQRASLFLTKAGHGDVEMTMLRFFPSHFAQVALGREAQAVDGVGSAVRPLAEFLRGLSEGHVGGDGAVDDGLRRGKQQQNKLLHQQIFTFIKKNKKPYS